MKKFIKISSYSLLVVLVGIQFFQPGQTTELITGNHLFNQTVVPEPVKQTLVSACLDCHSNQTNYQWYHRFAPVSWIIKDHIDEGLEELNFSDWGNLSPMDRLGVLEEVKEEIEKQKMPLKSYTLIHPDAKLTEQQKSELFSWLKQYQEQLAVELIND